MPLSHHPATDGPPRRRRTASSKPVSVSLRDEDIEGDVASHSSSSSSSSSGSSVSSLASALVEASQNPPPAAPAPSTPPSGQRQQRQTPRTPTSPGIVVVPIDRNTAPPPPASPRTPMKVAAGGTAPPPPQSSVQVIQEPRQENPKARSSSTSSRRQPLGGSDCTSSSKGILPPSSNKKQSLRRMNISDPVEEATADQRLVDYFIVVSSKPKIGGGGGGGTGGEPQTTQQQHQHATAGSNDNDNNINQQGRAAAESRQEDDNSRWSPGDAATGAGTVEAGTTTTTANSTTMFAPKITARYPAVDYADNPLNAMIPQFCFPTLPHDFAIQPVSTYELPRVHHFVLTNEKGRKVYGTCLTVFEEVMPSSDEDSSKQQQSSSSSSSFTVLVDELSSFAYNLAGVEVANNNTNSPQRNSDGQEVVQQQQQKRPKAEILYVPKVLCILSSWPYLTAFREYLAQLYRLATMTNIMSAPIERYITNICCEIPAPPPGAYEIQVNILDSTIRFWAPPGKLPLAHVALPFQILFECLDVEHILHVWSALITERKILLLSSQFSILTICCEVLCSLLFPLRWSHLYIPLLPRNFCAVLDAPVPYLCGLVRECWSHAKPYISPETIVVDLDRNTITYGTETPRIPEVPIKKWNKLFNSLQETVGHLHWKTHGLEESYQAMMALKPKQRSMEQLRQKQEGQGRQQWMEKLDGLDRAFNLAYTPESKLIEDYYRNNYGDDSIDQKVEQTPWDKVQEAFLRFFVAILKNYRRYLFIPPASTAETGESDMGDHHHHHPFDSSGGTSSSSGRVQPSFDAVAFLASQPAHSGPFLYQMCMSQQFDSFITRRMYSPGEPDLIFFDQSIDAKLNRSKLKVKKVETPFLHSVHSHKVLTKMKAVAPNEEGLPSDNEGGGGAPYVYPAWPDTLNESLFSMPRPIPKMISAEFDRQAILVSRLRAHGDEDDLFVEFNSAEYDPSPEVAVFTVFFFVYSSLVGLQWQEYKKKLQEAENKKKERTTEGVEARDGIGGDEERKFLCHQGESEEREGESYIYCTDDFSMGVCGACSEYGLMSIKSTLWFFGEGAEDVYTTLIRETADKFTEIQRQLTALGGAESKSQDSCTSENATEAFEEAREVAMSQLDLAFESLSTLELRDLPADLDAYKSLMEACGRCGDPHRALKLMERMKKDGFAADSELLNFFVESFAHEDGAGDCAGENSPMSDMSAPLKGDGKVGYSSLMRKELSYHNEDEEGHECCFVGKNADDLPECLDETRSLSTTTSCESSQTGNHSLAGGWFDYRSIGNRIKRPRKRRAKAKGVEAMQSRPTTPRLSTQFDMGDLLLTLLYPDLKIDSSSETCPHCSHVLSENDVVSGWAPCSFQEYKTECPKCQHSFVPHFSVSCSSSTFQGSQGPRSALFCEFLSPWVVRKALQHVIKGDRGIEGMLDPHWRSGTDIRATLFWNLIVLFRHYHLPFGFLLQGSVQGRLILPRTPNDMP